MNLASTIEAWNYANIELDSIDSDLEKNARHLVAAKKSLVVAQSRIATRLRDLYVNGSGDSTLEVLLGASSLDDIVSRLERHRARVAARTRGCCGRSSSSRRRSRRAATGCRRRAPTRPASSPSRRRRRPRSSRASRSASRCSPRSRTRSCSCRRRSASARPRSPPRLVRGSRRSRRPRRPPRSRATPTRTASRRSRTFRPARRFRTGAGRRRSSRSRCSTSASRTCGVGRARRRDSTARASSATSTRRSAIYLPHHAASAYGYGVPVSYSELQPGDLVFFNGLGHMGMYIGGGQFIHAPHTGDVVKISSLAGHGSFVGARRVL